jgi:hypothetical protein
MLYELRGVKVSYGHLYNPVSWDKNSFLPIQVINFKIQSFELW